MLLVYLMQFSFLLFYKKKLGPVKILQDQQMLGVTSPTGPVSFWVTVEACFRGLVNLEGWSLRWVPLYHICLTH